MVCDYNCAITMSVIVVTSERHCRSCGRDCVCDCACVCACDCACDWLRWCSLLVGGHIVMLPWPNQTESERMGEALCVCVCVCVFVCSPTTWGLCVQDLGEVG